jgi:hypothetical protein
MRKMSSISISDRDRRRKRLLVYTVKKGTGYFSPAVKAPDDKTKLQRRIDEQNDPRG